TSTYTFQLRKHKYETSGFEVIAQSEGLIIRGCGLTGGCEINPIDAPIVQISDPVVSNVNGSNLSDVSHHEGSGPLPGSAGVSGGAATYNIPMVLPPGRKGMAPELSINYSSKGGNGVMGMGWSVPMGSSIYRCPATKAQDNYFHAVDFTDEDRLCLDGQKLKRISGSYLVTNSEYRNELDSFAKIKYNDYVNSEGLTVDMFKVFTKSGRVNTYEQLGNQQSTWYLVNEQDSFGNSINYSYNEYSDEIDPVFGVNEYLVTEIWYTGTGYSHGTRRIKFNYGTDGYDIYYQAGEASEKTQRLNSVQTFVDSVMEREYAFTFKASNSDGKRLLTKVTEKAGGVSGVTRDLTDVLLWSDEDWVANGDNFDHFEYSNISTLATGTNAISASLLNKAQIKSDFNGDGIKEFITTSNDQDTRKMLFFNSNNQLKGVLGLGGTTGYRFANVVGNADFNVDGITDMMIIDKDGNNCPGAVTNSIKILTWDNDKKLVDDVLVDDGTIDQYFNTSEYCGINLDSYIADGITLEVDIEKSKFYLTDYNSDGLQDIIFHRVPKIINNQALCYPGGFTTGEAACTDGVDATSDLIAYLNNTDINSCSTTGSCNYSFTKQTGDPIAELITHGDREAEDDLFVVIWQTVDDMDDYNGDGLVDFHVRTWYKISVTQEAHARYAVRDDKIYFSTVTSDDLTLTPISLRGMGLRDFDCDLTEASVEENCYDETLQHSQAFGYKFTDVNGDGLKDYLYYDKGESYLRSWKVRLNKGGNILSDLFSGESINSTLNSDENLAFLDQYDECENLDDNSPDEQFRICNPYFRIASEFVDLNGDGIQEFVFPDPDPQAESSDGGISYQSEKMPFNYCGQFQSDGIEVYDFTTYDYTLFNFLSFLDNISDIPYVPDGVNDIIHDGGNSDSQADWLAGIFNSVYTYTPGIDPDLIGITKFACSYSHKDNVDSLGEKINDIYRDFGSSSATYDHGVYPYKALKFDIVKDINGDDVLDLKLIEKTGIYKPLFAGSIGDINGDGLVDVFSAMGCV
ncbi:MAG: SpvB/TcaC N-terminal domain-containing protein, partial [Marinicella sp.]